ncbi:MAG: DUF1405 domain-containing protein [Actinobacteria bacterium]|nr:DUF1405 domain-containing protein [Actinomycetota bacterium]
MFRLRRHWRSFLSNPWQPRYILLILAINIPGSVYGYYWYAEQLASTPKRLLLFVPDSPLATTLLSFVLILALLGHRNLFFSLLALAACIKYGLWAAVVISDFWLGGGAVGWETVLLWFSHLGMAAQGVIYMRAGPFVFPARGMARAAAVVSAWMLLNDFMDYHLGIHPYLYYYGQEPMAAVSAWGLSATVIIYIFIIFGKSVRWGW